MAERDRDFVDQAFDKIRNDFAAAMGIAGEESQARIEQYVSIPVEYAGSRVIRSLPGESPRLEFGVYHSSFHNIVMNNPDAVVLILFSDDPKAPYLEIGTDSMAPRPAFSRILAEWQAGLLGRITEIFRETSPT